MPVFKMAKCFGCDCLLFEGDWVFEHRYTDLNEAGDIVEVVEYYCLDCYEKRVVERDGWREKKRWEEWKQKHLGLK